LGPRGVRRAGQELSRERRGIGPGGNPANGSPRARPPFVVAVHKPSVGGFQKMPKGA